jgi:osmotically inducible protein OsmC
MPIHKAEAAWHGTFRDGEGEMKLGSGAFEGAYSYRSRMEGSAPAPTRGVAGRGARRLLFDVLGAQALGGRLPPGAHPHRSPGTLRALGEGYAISRIDLRTEAEVPGVDEGLFLEKAEDAKRDCAVSKALAGVEEITLEARLVEHAG